MGPIISKRTNLYNGKRETVDCYEGKIDGDNGRNITQSRKLQEDTRGDLLKDIIFGDGDPLSLNLDDFPIPQFSQCPG
jgi:hypothetical protein